MRQAHEPELVMTMTGLRNYLRETKVGEPFESLKTFMGCKEYLDKGDEDEPRTGGAQYMI